MRKPIRVSDAIPKMPVSFEQTVERTLNSVCKEQKSSVRTKERTAENRWVPTGESVRTTKKQPKIRQLLAYGAVAVLLVAVVGIGALVIKNGLSGKQTELSQGMTDQTELPRAIRYHGMVYVITDHEAAGEPDKSAILKTTENPVPSVQWPTEEGQTNFGETSYAMTIDGLVVLYDNEWCMFEPLLPDTNKGVFEAAYAQVLLEQYEFDRTYAARRAKMETMSEEEAQDYDTIMEGEENFLHQRFVRLQRLNEVTASVEQEVDRMRLSEIAYLDGRLYFAFAASKVWAFDAEPEIRINGTQYHAIDDSGFFALKETETEHYAFYEIEPGTLSGTVQITVKNNDHAFCFKYDADSSTVALPQDDAQFEEWFNGGEETVLLPTPAPNAAAEPVIPCEFVTAEQHVSPYAEFANSNKGGLAADGIGLVYLMPDEQYRSQIPIMTYHDDLAIESPNEIVQISVYNESGERIAFQTDLNYLKTLAPGLYYVSALVSVVDSDGTTGYDCVCGVVIGITASQEPDATDAPTPSPTAAVRFNGTTYRMTGESYVGGILLSLGTVESVQTGLLPYKDNCANFGEPGMMIALVSDGLVVDYGGWKRLEPIWPQMDGPAAAGYTVPAIRYQGVLYLWAVAEDGNALSFNDEYICYSLSSAVSPGQWPTEEEQINFDGLGCKVAQTKDGLLIEYEGNMLLFRPVQEVPAVFRQGSAYTVPYWDMVAYSSPDFEADGISLARKLSSDGDWDLESNIPTVQYSGKPIDVTPRGWTFECVYLIDPDGDLVWVATASELERMEECYELPMTPIAGAMADNEHNEYYLCALVMQRDGDVTRSMECVIRLALS